MADTALEGYSALVTGGGSGIGLGCAVRLAADGASVTICGRSEDRLRAAVDQIGGVGGGQADYVVADVTQEDQVDEAVVRASQATGRLEAVVACAGGSETIGPLTLTDAERWRRTIELNLTGTMLTLKHAAAVMVRSGGGSFVGVSSIASSNTHRWFGAYGVAKAGIDHLCRLAADELGASNVRVNCVRPGLVRTALVAGLMGNEAVVDDYLSCMPIRRVGEPEDVANLVRFLVGPESTWITGQCINVDGGHSLRRGPNIAALVEPAFGADALRGVVP
ncbi:MAG TPA: SDR family oxidoreductase [Acidimicrobiales bacterium]|nr:SDR family oxidoreductase [Acidimicrobiales bacterium]